jgi:RHS repeat-associated protein
MGQDATAMTWSMAGNMESDGKGTSFTHDGLQHLTKATRTGLVIHYAYNSAGLRIESIKNPQTALDARDMPVGGDRTRYVLSGAEEVADLDGGRNVIRRYIPGAAIDERVAQIETNGAISFMHNDKQNSKCAIALRATLAQGVIAISDSAGNPVAKRAYGTYGGEADKGEVRGTSTPPNDPAQMVGTPATTTTPAKPAHPFGYTGRRWEPELGLYYYRARWYDPALGTFLETDPIGSLDYINLYAYVGLEPGNGVDPTGKTLECEGSKQFCNGVSQAIKKIEEGRNGRALVQKLRGSEQRNIIRQAKDDSGNAVQVTSNTSTASNLTRNSGTYGKPSGSIVEWGSSQKDGGRDVNGSTNRPSFLGLANELGHARANNLGVQTSSSADPAPPLNAREIGYVPPSEVHSVANENAVRVEHGLPLRYGY